VSIWSKVISRTTGALFGGAIGTLLGRADRRKVDREGDRGDATKEVAFTIGVVVLGAKMAKADGVVTRDEVRAFREVFHVPPEELKNVGRVFDMARRDAAGYEPYARQIARLFVGNAAVLEDLLHGLFHIAKADGVIHPAELAYLEGVAELFGFDGPAFQRIRAHHMPPDASDPYVILGVAHDAGDNEVRRAYRRLIREHHPDRLIAQGVPQEFVDLGSQKMAHINEAYERIRRQRGVP
jgi:DnaJ like chaperone protein